MGQGLSDVRQMSSSSHCRPEIMRDKKEQVVDVGQGLSDVRQMSSSLHCRPEIQKQIQKDENKQLVVVE